MLCSCGSSYSKRSSIAIRPIGPQVPANRLDQRSASLLFEQPSSTSTVSLSTVRRGGLSTSTTKSDARHERMLCSCKLRLRRASPTVGLLSVHGLLGLRRLYAVGAKVCSYIASNLALSLLLKSRASLLVGSWVSGRPASKQKTRPNNRAGASERVMGFEPTTSSLGS